MFRFIFLAVLLFFGWGCSVGPNYKRPEIYNDEEIKQSLNLSADSSISPNQDWYKSFQDETLNHLINTTLQNAPDIAIAKEKLRQARINLGITRSEFGPEIDISGDYSNNKTFETKNYRNKLSYYKTGFDASWEIDIWGKTRRLNESSKALWFAAAADFDYVKISLTAEVAADYINYRQNEKLLQITEQNLKLQQDIYDIVKQKHIAGLSDDLALEQAQSSLLITEMQIPSLKAAVNSYQNALAVLSGILPHQLELKESNILDQQPLTNVDDIHKLSANVVLKRPDVKVAEQNLIAQNALIGHQIAAMFPNVSLSAFLGWQNTTLAPIFSSEYQIYNSGAGINLPLWNWKRLLNQVYLQKSKTKQALVEYQKSILTAVSDINQAMKNLEEEIMVNKNAKQNQSSQTKILELSMIKYNTGLIEFSDVLIAEQNKLSADQEYIKSLARWYLDIISFNKSVGGGLSL